MASIAGLDTWQQHLAHASFRHEALLYTGIEGFMQGTLPFLHAGLANDEPTLVIVSAEKIDRLRRALADGARNVTFVDMTRAGTNPARLIPAWRDFVDEHSGARRALRGIGEPIWADRSAAELIECQRHEALLNLAFPDDPPLLLLCPYDVASLDAAVVDEARRSHPVLVEGAAERESPSYRDARDVARPFAAPLPNPPGRPRELPFDRRVLGALRQYVSALAIEFGLSPERTTDLVLAVNELATNSVRHAHGRGVVRTWSEGDTLICEVRDDGCIDEPLAGRLRPNGTEIGGHGLWMVNQLCELVQVRSFASGNVVRLHMRRT